MTWLHIFKCERAERQGHARGIGGDEGVFLGRRWVILHSRSLWDQAKGDQEMDDAGAKKDK